MSLRKVRTKQEDERYGWPDPTKIDSRYHNENRTDVSPSAEWEGMRLSYKFYLILESN